MVAWRGQTLAGPGGVRRESLPGSTLAGQMWLGITPRVSLNGLNLAVCFMRVLCPVSPGEDLGVGVGAVAAPTAGLVRRWGSCAGQFVLAVGF